MVKASLEGRLAADAAFLFGNENRKLGLRLFQLRLDLGALCRVTMPSSARSSSIVVTSS